MLAAALGANPPLRLPAWLGRLLLGEAGMVLMKEVPGAAKGGTMPRRISCIRLRGGALPWHMKAMRSKNGLAGDWVGRRDFRAVPCALLGAALLWALFLPAADAQAHLLRLDFRPQTLLLALLAVIAGLALLARRLPRLLRAALAVLLFAVALLQAADAALLQILDREIDLYFDLQHVPSLIGLLAGAIGPWRTAGLLLLAAGGVFSISFGIAWSLASLERFLALDRRFAGAVALIGLAGAAAPVFLAAPPVSSGAIAALSRQASSLYGAWSVVHGYDSRYAAALAAPEPAPAPLPRLAGHDVLLVFVESYGTVTLDEPRLRAIVAPALDALASTVSKAGYQLVSGRLVSPTFGGGSWLAHGTIASGVKLDPLLARLMPETKRMSLARYMAQAGYATVEVMPGIKKPWPEADFWGFQRSYYAADLGYDGPAFGWFGIPDQFTLRRFAERELGPGHAPLFAQIVLVSSHTPFAPVPPYVEDWRQAASFDGITQPEWDRIYTDPDWSNLEAPYLQSIVYDLKTLGAFLARIDGSPLVIVLGDHQPPGIGADRRSEPWTVPVHVLARDPALLRPFAALGYAEGPLPPSAGAKGMESFLADFLAAYEAPQEDAARRVTP